MLSRGGTVFFIGSNADATTEAFDFYGVENWVGAPAGLANYLEYYESHSNKPCTLKMMMSGGSQLSVSLSERVRARMCTNLVAAYGSTETSMVAAGPGHVVAKTQGAVGYLTPGMTVQAVNESDDPLPPGQEGLIRIRGPFNATEYIGDPKESSLAFRNGWFYPGDIGAVTADRMLVISGRQKTVMNLGGDKVKPELVEAVLSSFGGVEDAAAFTVINQFGIEEMWAAVVSRSGIDERSIHVHCQQKLPHNFVPVRFVRLDAIPRNEMGKIDRRQLPELAKARSH
jgi:acyl-CoA synthetase (AMP-forming)/AMP-acid ligase II